MINTELTVSSNVWDAKRNNKPVTEEVKRVSKETKDAYIRNKIIKFSTDMKNDLYGGQKKIWNTLWNRKKTVNPVKDKIWHVMRKEEVHEAERIGKTGESGPRSDR